MIKIFESHQVPNSGASVFVKCMKLGRSTLLYKLINSGHRSTTLSSDPPIFWSLNKKKCTLVEMGGNCTYSRLAVVTYSSEGGWWEVDGWWRGGPSTSIGRGFVICSRSMAAMPESVSGRVGMSPQCLLIFQLKTKQFLILMVLRRWGLEKKLFVTCNSPKKK